jgi:hypothetical protein
MSIIQSTPRRRNYILMKQTPELLLHKNMYLNTMVRYSRMSRRRALEQYMNLEKEFRSCNKFIKFLLLEIESAKQDFEWRRKHVTLWSRWT